MFSSFRNTGAREEDEGPVAVARRVWTLVRQRCGLATQIAAAYHRPETTPIKHTTIVKHTTVLTAAALFLGLTTMFLASARAASAAKIDHNARVARVSSSGHTLGYYNTLAASCGSRNPATRCSS